MPAETRTGEPPQRDELGGDARIPVTGAAVQVVLAVMEEGEAVHGTRKIDDGEAPARRQILAGLPPHGTVAEDRQLWQEIAVELPDEWLEEQAQGGLRRGVRTGTTQTGQAAERAGGVCGLGGRGTDVARSPGWRQIWTPHRHQETRGSRQTRTTR